MRGSVRPRPRWLLGMAIAVAAVAGCPKNKDPEAPPPPRKLGPGGVDAGSETPTQDDLVDDRLGDDEIVEEIPEDSEPPGNPTGPPMR